MKTDMQESTPFSGSRPIGRRTAWLLIFWVAGCSAAYYAVFLSKLPMVQRFLTRF